MASPEEIAQLRRLINMLEDVEPYTDLVLDALIDSSSVNDAALGIWREKAASYADLVSVSEGNSRRELSQLQDHALKMVAHFGSLITPVVNTTRRTTTRPIERA